ncbi:type VI secretion system amidase effector protein Tae4 [Moritella sp. 36]|uniref:type VI secretion system amidase effector protein Tae4 n=1 Tax=Moritella sp. 36 TaxID=2746233 RepID=UPI001BA504F9|nr:type VI secretion system amidase effector protein Tae4 [Moritella sp. 36]QUM89866.1 type VI secretion system amidase effector protein Tae4 [Moritella sp. 36]
MPTFKKIWDNHPSVENFFDDFPCIDGSGSKAFDNQCAIRIGVALDATGISTAGFTGARCWHGHKPGHILRAEELANWLKGASSPFKTMIKFEAKDGFSKINGKKGIIFFKDYYGANNQGDHIDLWNGSRLTRYSSWIEFAARGGSHYSKSTVWFWPVA